MSKFYTAVVSNEGLDAIRSDFKVIIRADSIAQARAGAAARIITVERATDQEIFEAGRNGNVILNLSDLPTDGIHPDQQPLPIVSHAVDVTKPSAHDGTIEGAYQGLAGNDVQLTGETASGSAPAWLPLSERVAQNTGD